MSLFSLLQSQANRKRLDAAKGLTKTKKKLDRAEKVGRSVGLYSTRDKKGSAGTKAGFGRRTGRSQSLGPSPQIAPSKPKPNPGQARQAGGRIRQFVGSVFNRLRGR